MNFILEKDNSRSVITALDQIHDVQHGQPVPAFPKQAVVFCYGYGLDFLKSNHHAKIWLKKLPRFLSGGEVYMIEGYEDVCFLHGGAGSPMIADTIEVLVALGVEQFYLLGLCGVFDGMIKVGDIVIPTRVLSEEGTSRHYVSDIDFVEADMSKQRQAYHYFKALHVTYLMPTVTTDAIYRQTFKKEAYWRTQGCVGVDMEASAFLTVCHYYNKKGTVILMASDVHPLTDSQSWTFGKKDFMTCRENFTAQTLQFILRQQENDEEHY
ncbi:MAG: nucleoside phosphorylase [Beduini sp.]|uniref:nucleoside phosphorylase n=1 Tax=Beduini sp. TaxID=1922300 RepID=UPI00399EE9D1